MKGKRIAGLVTVAAVAAAAALWLRSAEPRPPVIAPPAAAALAEPAPSTTPARRDALEPAPEPPPASPAWTHEPPVRVEAPEPAPSELGALVVEVAPLAGRADRRSVELVGPDGDDAWTDAQGRVEWRELRPGRYTVVAHAMEAECHAILGTPEDEDDAENAAALLLRTLELDVRAGETTHARIPADPLQPVDVRLTLAIDGVLVDDWFVAANRHASSLKRPSALDNGHWRAPSPFAQADEDGACTLTLVTGRWGLEARVSVDSVPLRLVLEADLAPGDPRIDLELATGTLTGRVHDASGPVADEWVTVIGAGPPWVEALVRTDAAGEYALRLPEGAYRVGFSGGPLFGFSGEPRFARVEREDVRVLRGLSTTLDLELAPGGGVRLFPPRDAERAARARLSLHGPVGTFELHWDGSHSFGATGLPPGVYETRAEGEVALAAPLTLEVVAGEFTEAGVELVEHAEGSR